MHGLAVYVKEGLPFAQDLSLENSAEFTSVFDWLYFTQCLTSFSTINHRLRPYAPFFYFSSSNIDEVLSINPSANVFVFGDFNVHHKDWLNYSGLCYNFSTSKDLTQRLTFLLGFLTVTVTVLHFRVYLFLLMLVFVLQWLFLYWEILIMLLPQFPLTFS